MNFTLILAIIAITIFLVYNGIAIYKFGIPYSLSNTFYLYNKEKRNLGYVFTGMMFALAACLFPAWLQLSDSFSSWSHYLTPIAFLAGSAIAFVGAAPAFRSSKMEDVVHSISAGIAAATALIWDVVVCYKFGLAVLAGSVLLVGGLAHWTKTYKSGMMYWLEMIAFLTTFITIMIALLV